MKSNARRIQATLVLVLGLAALAGCEPQKPAASASTGAPVQEVSVDRTTAIQQAQRDAAYRYAEVQVARVDAHRQGSFWVVELTSTSGSGLRYTISAQDGSIRQRNLFQ
jgi:hypothetical protein